VVIGYVLDETGLVGAPGEWVEIGRYDWGIDAPSSLYLGLAVTSHTGCEISTITFEDWIVLPSCSSPVDNLTCTVQGENLQLTWENPAASNPAVPISIRIDNVEYTTVPGSSTSASIPVNLFTAGVAAKISVVNDSTLPSDCYYPPGYSDQGFIRDWLLLGPHKQPAPPAGGTRDAPTNDGIRRDFLTDNAGITELNVEPRAGDTVNTAFRANPAWSTGLALTPENPDLNPGGVPTWAAFSAPADTVNFNLNHFKSTVINAMMYAVTYIDVPADTVVDMGVSSDDSVQVLLDGEEIWINSIARGFDVPNFVQDVVPNINLTAGKHRIMVKVFQGLGDFGFRLRFQDQSAPPNYVIAGDISLTPGGVGGPVFHRGDADQNMALELTDAIQVLGYLFLGSTTRVPECEDAADADDNGVIELTDAIRILGYLFLGTGEIPAPGPTENPCGEDPTPDGDVQLGCVSYDPASCQ